MFERKLERLTRKSYRRKLIMFGASIFMSLALVATGFAAWVLSKDAQVQDNGSVEVGKITESNIEIEGITFVKDGKGNDIKNFVFEPQEGDTAGRVRNDGVNFEDMDIVLSWTVSNYQIVGDLFVEFKIPANVQSAIDAGYLSLPVADGQFEKQPGTETIGEKVYHVYKLNIGKGLSETGTIGTDLLSYTVTDEDGIKSIACTMTLKFNWGSVFGGQNPGVYYDTDGTGKGIDYDTVKDNLYQFKTTLHGIAYDDTFKALSDTEKYAKYTANPIDNYIVVINAIIA